MPKTKEESIPRFRIILQDGVTEVQIAAGTDDINKFARTDLLKPVEHFKTQVKSIENSVLSTAIKKQVSKRKTSK